MEREHFCLLSWINRDLKGIHIFGPKDRDGVKRRDVKRGKNFFFVCNEILFDEKKNMTRAVRVESLHEGSVPH